MTWLMIYWLTSSSAAFQGQTRFDTKDLCLEAAKLFSSRKEYYGWSQGYGPDAICVQVK